MLRSGLVPLLSSVILLTTSAPVAMGARAGDSTETDVDELKRRADRGDADALVQLGWGFASGSGVPQSYEDAANCYLRALLSRYALQTPDYPLAYRLRTIARHGFQDAMEVHGAWGTQDPRRVCFNLGLLAESGPEAVKWFKKAALQGHTSAQFNLGLLYASGLDVPEDFAEARKWFQRAAADGCADAAHAMGILFSQGLGSSPDFEKATYWFRIAIEHGSVHAINDLASLEARSTDPTCPSRAVIEQWAEAADASPLAAANLGIAYLKGYGVSPDPKEAVAWLSKGIALL